MLPIIAKEYAPYDTLPEFAEGFLAYGKTWQNPYDESRSASFWHEGHKAQAWDRGLECAARCARWASLNVGQD
jgi:hypothetical protein